LLHIKLAAGGHETHLVIQRNTMSYERAIVGHFTAHAQTPGHRAMEGIHTDA
jgi:hypothetical protein